MIDNYPTQQIKPARGLPGGRGGGEAGAARGSRGAPLLAFPGVGWGWWWGGAPATLPQMAPGFGLDYTSQEPLLGAGGRPGQGR